MKLSKLCLYIGLLLAITIKAQTVNVGLGSYGTVLPSGAVGPQTSAGVNVMPKVSSTFQKPVQTCDYWSSLIYPFYGDSYSNNMFAHPLNYRAKNNGLQMGYTITPVYAAQDYLYPFQQQLTVGVTGMNATKTVTDDYGDWTVTAVWDDGIHKMKATLGHGLPFAYFIISGGKASITSTSTPAIWYNQLGVIGMTVEGRHYGIFAPDSSLWTGTTTLQSSLNGKNYFSVAILPDNSPATLEIYRKHAYAFVTGSTVEWLYNETTANLTSTFTYSTELKETKNGNLNKTLTALYRHQWLNTSVPLTSFEYVSVAGKMMVFDGNQFTTNLTFEGVLPSLPDQGVYNRTELAQMVNFITLETLPASGGHAGTYWNGKLIARFAHLVNIADQLGEITARNYFINQIKTRLQEWFTAGGTQSYVYNSTWKTLTGYPSEFGADNQINDHNFHAGYAIMGAAIVAQYDSVWAANNNWGGMVNLLIKDGNNYDRGDARFPFLRAFDAYAGHSWESGHGDFGDGNNEESSSESMNFASAVILWGAATNQNDVRDLGIYLYTTERSAIEQYWFDVDNYVFPASYQYKALGMVWGAKGVHSTWFGADPEYIHGINMLPFTGGSMYLGRNTEYVQNNYNEITNELNGNPTIWKDIIWQYLSLTDPGKALSMFFADPDYTPEDGETKAHTYHWLGNMKKMGQLDISVTADIPTYSVFKNPAGEKTYIAYNPGSVLRAVHFSDGYVMNVPPKKMEVYCTADINVNAPVAILTSNKTSGKIPLTINLSGSRSYDRNGLPLIYEWNFGDGQTSNAVDTNYVFANPGTYKVILTVTNQLSLSSKDSVIITALGNGTPYSGTPVLIPAIIQAENYDKGGEGIAYHDVEANNIGLAYRPNEGVDIEASSVGYDVYWMVAGEWLEYTIQVPTAGNYDIIPYVASVPGFGNFRIFVNNNDVSGKRQVLNTGGWQSWKPMTVNNVLLNAGKQILRFEINTDYDSEKKNWLYSLNYIQINQSDPSAVGDETTIPTEFFVSQNYPNPFNPATIIKYSLPVDCKVIIKIYNTIGQDVAVLKDEIISAGEYELNFNASSIGGGLSSGVYFYSIQADALSGGKNYREVKKMSLIK